MHATAPCILGVSSDCGQWSPKTGKVLARPYACRSVSPGMWLRTCFSARSRCESYRPWRSRARSHSSSRSCLPGISRTLTRSLERPGSSNTLHLSHSRSRTWPPGTGAAAQRGSNYQWLRVRAAGSPRCIRSERGPCSSDCHTGRTRSAGPPSSLHIGARTR